MISSLSREYCITENFCIVCQDVAFLLGWLSDFFFGTNLVIYPIGVT